jgi:(p)ppGpp synthase/HD superfamily hydrolase
MTARLTQALMLAAEAHQGQVRKGTSIPYITHPVAVAGLVARYGGDEDQQIAGLLHDVLEDAGADWAPRIAAFGPRVLAMVQACTDGTPDATGQKRPWQERKQAYLAHLAETPAEALLVSACDKLHNAESILLDLAETGPGVFDRFSASQEQTLWYYRELARIFAERHAAPAEALDRAVKAITDCLKF